jgi:hypothetical protein
MIKFNARSISYLFALGAAVGVCSLGSKAQADVIFHNTTGQRVYFQVVCSDSSTWDSWSVGPNSNKDLYCNNTDILTAKITSYIGNDKKVVWGNVFDGNAYDIDYDSDGFLSFDQE